MPNSVIIQTLEDGPRNVKYHVYITGDGSGDETNLDLVETLALNPIPETVKVIRVHGRFEGFSATLTWGSDVGDYQDFLTLPDNDDFDFRYWQTGLSNPKVLGWNGDIVMDTKGLGAGDEGHFDIHVVKKERENIG